MGKVLVEIQGLEQKLAKDYKKYKKEHPKTKKTPSDPLFHDQALLDWQSGNHGSGAREKIKPERRAINKRIFIYPGGKMFGFFSGIFRIVFSE